MIFNIKVEVFLKLKKKKKRFPFPPRRRSSPLPLHSNETARISKRFENCSELLSIVSQLRTAGGTQEGGL